MVILTPMSKIYEKSRKIRGKPARKINIMKTGETLYSSTIAIANCLADSFAAVASTSNYSDEFSKVKWAAESINIPFVSDNHEEYNEVFTLAELFTLAEVFTLAEDVPHLLPVTLHRVRTKFTTSC